MAVNIPKLEYDLTQARKKLKGQLKSADRTRLQAKVAELEAAIKTAKTPTLVIPEPTPVVAVAELPAVAAAIPTPLPPSVRVKGKGRLATGSSHRDIKVTFGGKVPDKALDAIDAAFAGLRQRRTARA